MNRLKQQLSLVSELLFTPETRDTYSKALSLTGKLLKEILTLLWMIFCLVFLVFFWAGQYVRQITYNTKVWYQNQENQHSENRFADFSKSLLEVGSSSSRYVITQAKQQLGIQGDPKPIPAIAPVATVNAETVLDTDPDNDEPEETSPEPEETSPEPSSIPDPFDSSDSPKSSETP